MKMKRMLSALLAAVMVMTMLPLQVLAEDGTAQTSGQLYAARLNEGKLGNSFDALNLDVGDEEEYAFYYGSADSRTYVVPQIPQLVSTQAMADGSIEDDAVKGMGIVLTAQNVGTGVISYTDGNGMVYAMPIEVKAAETEQKPEQVKDPDMLVYDGVPSAEAEPNNDEVVLTADDNVFYIALSSTVVGQGSRMKEVIAKDETINTPELRGISNIVISDDKTYAEVTIIDMKADGRYYFRVEVVNAAGGPSGYWGCDIRIENDMPKLYWCDLNEDEEDGWEVDYRSLRDEWWCTPGSGRPACFFFGSRSEIRRGNVAPLAKEALSFPGYLQVQAITEEHNKPLPANTLAVDCKRYANQNEATAITYTKNGKVYSIEAEPTLPDIGFYTDAEARKATAIFGEKPFVVTENDRTFYLVVGEDAEGVEIAFRKWDSKDGAEDSMFDVEKNADGEYVYGKYIKFTVKDNAIVPNEDVGVWANVKWLEEDEDGEMQEVVREERFWVSLKNGQPALMYRFLDWDNTNQEWTEDSSRPLETHLGTSTGNRNIVKFYYGTPDQMVPVSMDELTFPTDIVKAYIEDGVLAVEGIGFEQNGYITYTNTKDNVTVKMQVSVSQPRFALYSSNTASKGTYLGEEVELGGDFPNTFYLVARDKGELKEVLSLENRNVGRSILDAFEITVDPDGKWIAFARKNDADLPGGDCELTYRYGDAGNERRLHFELIRMDLDQLTTPTDLEWHVEYDRWYQDGTLHYEKIERKGAMSYQVNKSQDGRGLTQNRFAVEIYSVVDGSAMLIHEGHWGFGDTEDITHFTITDFIYEDLPGGTYKFRVRNEGDGVKFRSSEWSAWSPEYEYTPAETRLETPDANTFRWEKWDGRYISSWEVTDEAGAGYYEVKWAHEENGEMRINNGNFDMRIDWGENERPERMNSPIQDEMLEQYGNTNIWFRVRVIPYDIEQYRVSEWSAFSDALDVDAITELVNNKLDTLIPTTPSDPSDPGQPAQTITVEDVQQALADDTADLRVAMAADLSINGGQNSGTLDKIKALEAAVSDNVEQIIDAKNSAPQKIQDIASDVTMIGASLNLADKHPETGTPARMTLELDAPKEGIVIPEQQHNAVQFSMKLNGAIDKDDKAQAGQQLIVPVVIDMPVPAGINPEFLVVLHKLWDGSIEQMRPHIYVNEEDDKWHARFIVDSFSDFALIELEAGSKLELPLSFEAATVNKTVGDAPFVMAVSGAASDSTITYTSSDPAVASVDAETGEVTIHAAGTVIITATAAETDLAAEAQASYTLVIRSDSGSDGGNDGGNDGGAIVEPSYDDDDSAPTYRPSVEKAEGGEATVNKKNPEKGDTVTVTAKPEDGYVVDAVVITDRKGNVVAVTDNGDGTYAFKQPAGKVTITVTFKPAEMLSAQYTDLNPDLWYHEAVEYALRKGLMNGVGNGKFDPNGTTTRAMVWTVLARMDGVDTSVGENWYAAAKAWAMENGISDGTNATGPITREQFATILYRFAQHQGIDVSVGEDTNILSYEDAFGISEWAIPAMQWACGAGVMQGDGVRLMPADSATRAQMAQLLMNFCE